MPVPEGSPVSPARATANPPQATTIDLTISGPITPSEIPALCERVIVLLDRNDAEPLICDVSRLIHPDAGAIDALARLQLTARRCGHRLWIRNAGSDLKQLLDLVGLGNVLLLFEPLPFEPSRQSEERKQAGSVEEEADPGDPTA